MEYEGGGVEAHPSLSVMALALVLFFLFSGFAKFQERFSLYMYSPREKLVNVVPQSRLLLFCFVIDK